MKYAIYNPEKGYMYDDEDRLPGTPMYDHNIDEFTITFDNEKDAQFNCGRGDVVRLFNPSR